MLCDESRNVPFIHSPDHRGPCLAKGMLMAIEHIVVHKENDYHSAFPDIIRLQNGSLMVVFRQAWVRPGDGVVGDRNEKLTHEHLDPDSRIALVRSTDDGATWSPDSRRRLRRITGS